MSNFDTIDYFTDQSLVDNPFAYFEHLRAKCPVTALPHHGVVAVTGFDEANEVWRDSENFSSCAAVTGPFPGLPAAPEGTDISAFIEEHRGGLPMAEYLIAQDPPTHTANRGLLMRLLTPTRLKENEEFIWGLADAQIDEVIGKGSFELLREFAQPYALLVIADLLGVPTADHRAFRAQLGVAHPEPAVGEEVRERSNDPLAFLFDYFSSYVEERRKEPLADVLTQLALATYPDGSMPDVADVVRTATFLFAAGQDTTARLITAAIQLMADDPELQDLLRREPERIPNLIEEVLRLEGPVKTVSRVARVDMQIGGVDIAAGTTIAVFPHAANRDPRRFEDPNEFRFDRPNARTHIAFGRGAHTCPGGPLARVEARIAIERLLARTSHITLSDEAHGPVGDRHFEYEATYILRGVRALQVEVTPADS